MCSTPFGIIGIRTAPTRSLPYHILRCSTPFGIIGIRTRRAKETLASKVGVLNAFRHHRNSHAVGLTETRDYRVVLNAFRHHRNSHTPMVFTTCGSNGAQRLSASSEFAQHRLRESALDSECSTPFGIIGIRTRGGFDHVHAELTVLNAFRHHRNSHGLFVRLPARSR